MSSVVLNGEPSKEVDKSELMKKHHDAEEIRSRTNLSHSKCGTTVPPSAYMYTGILAQRRLHLFHRDASHPEVGLIRDLEIFELGRHE